MDVAVRVLVTGGTGLLGGALTEVCAARGWEVTATCHTQPPGAVGAAWSNLDVTDREGVRALMGDVVPEVVFHTAYVMKGEAMRAVTTDGAAHVAAAARGVGARLIHLSTDVVFDGERVGAYTESDPPRPVTEYGRAKADAERAVLAAHPDAAVVRTSLLYTTAPDDRNARMVLGLLDGAEQGALFTDELRCPVLVADLCAALIELAQGEHRGVIHVAGADTVSRHEFGALLARRHGRDPKGLPRALSADCAARRPRNCALDIALARRVLSTRLRGAREVLAV